MAEDKKEKEDGAKEAKSFGATAFLEIKDYFNYYMPGLMWIADIAFAWSLIDYNGLWRAVEAFSRLKDSVFLVLVALIPYLVGIVFAGFGNVIHCIDKLFLGKPERYVLEGPARRKWICTLGRSSLGVRLSCKITILINRRFEKLGKDSIFSLVRDSEEVASFRGASDKIARLTNLMNLYEGLVCPHSVAILLVVSNSRWLQDRVMATTGVVLHPRLTTAEMWFLLFVLGVLFLKLWWRYHYLRENVAKHVYRFFYLSRTSEKTGQKRHGNGDGTAGLHATPEHKP